MAVPPPPPPPPPSDDPFAGGAPTGGEADPFAYTSGDDGLSQGTPNVAAKPGRVILVLGIVGLVLVVLLYSIFFSGKKEGSDKPKERNVVQAPIEPPSLPKDNTPVAPPPSIVPPTIPEPANVSILKPQDDSAAKAQADARMRSKMMLEDGGGSGGLSGLLGGGAKAPVSNDPNSTFENNIAAANTKADRVEATRIGDLRRTIAQGRIIQATMESALNTDLPAPIRAIVSRDTYGEAGTVPLIPKGSRLIGTYNTDVTGGQSRVFVVWTRVIRPDGVDVMLNSPLVDQIGEAGIGGQVDTKFQSIFSRAILASIVSIGFATGVDKVDGGNTTTSTSSLGSSQTGDTASTATVNALNRLGAVTDTFIQRFVDVRPTILVDQGTPVNVFVNRDVIFPDNVGGTRVIN
jgi:type IV secretion system protein VirB10